MRDGFMGSGYIRRLPVYLLLDCSGSMAGDPITAIHEGLYMIHRLLIMENQPTAIANLCPVLNSCVAFTCQQSSRWVAETTSIQRCLVK